MPWHLTVRLLDIALSQLSARLKMPPALLESWWLRGCPAAFWGHWKQWVHETAVHGKALGMGRRGNTPHHLPACCGAGSAPWGTLSI